MKKPIYCCDNLRSNLNNECKHEGHGWTCPDLALYLYEDRAGIKDTHVCIPMNHDNNGVGAHWVITHCPWCGKKIKFEET